MNNCRNCNELVSSNYCSNCGQPSNLKRIDSHYIIHEIEHILHVERGILFTVKALLTRPGKTVQQFIAENRSRLVKPIIFIIITSLIYTFVTHLFHIESELVDFKGAGESSIDTFLGWMKKNYGYTNLIWGIFIAFWLNIFFRKYDYNFFEILILLCFVQGVVMLLYALFVILQGLTHLHVMQSAAVIGLVYCTWAIGQFFDKNKIVSYLKAFAAYVLGMITFLLSLISIGSLIDWLAK